MGNTSSPPEPSHEQDNVANASSSMKKLLSDKNTIDPKQSAHNAQFGYPQTNNANPYAGQHPYSTYAANTQQNRYRQNVHYSSNSVGYQPQTHVPQQTVIQSPVQHTQQTIVSSTPNTQPIATHLTARQLEFQLEQQMQQLRLLQKARQLERQRLDLARQQRDLDAQAASQQMQQNELIRQQQLQQQEREARERETRERQRAQQEATAKAAALARAQAQQLEQQRQKEAATAAAKSNAQTVVKDNEEITAPTKETYPVVFHWSHGGRDVYVAYSGDNWSQKYRMSRSHNDFGLIMEINPGVYHYKFIVDNQWRCALDQKLVRDANGAYTNVLHVRSHSYQQVIDEQKKKRKREKQKAQYQYTQNLPKSDHYVQDPSVCPIHLHKVILNNENDTDEEGNDDEDGRNNMREKKKKKSNVNTMELPKPLRVSLNHLYVSDRREEEVVTLGMTERYRDKFFTTVYYTPMMETSDTYEDGNYY
eukprot:230884_1